jgi:hypothetical protein
MQVPHFTTEQSRQRLLSAVLAYANGGANLFATPREQHYLAQFQRGRLTIDEVVYYLESAKSF